MTTGAWDRFGGHSLTGGGCEGGREGGSRDVISDHR